MALPDESLPRFDWRLLLFVLFGWCVLSGVYTYRTAQLFNIASPPGPGDGPEYEAIAFQLWQGRGYRLDFLDEAWRRAYVKALEQDARSEADRADYKELLSRSGEGGFTTNRPPLFPMLTALTYTVTGRRFDVIRVANCLWMAAAVSLFLPAAVRWFGWSAGWLLLLTAAIDKELHAFAGTFLTESLAAFWVSALVLSLTVATRRSAWRWWVTAGVCLGVAVYARSIFVLWVPLLAPVMLCCRGEVTVRRRSAELAVMLGVATLVYLPWAARTCYRLGAFQPLGGFGQISLVGGYSDEALALGGLWDGAAMRRIQGRLEADPAYRALPLPQRELVLSEACGREARAWAWRHVADLPRLAVGRVYHLWWRESVPHTLFYLVALSGAFVGYWRPELRWILVLLVINTVVIAVVYCGGGRFLVPLRPSLHLLAAAGVVTAWRCFRNRLVLADAPKS